MNSEQQRRLAERFARAWKRNVRADDGLRHRQENLEAREREFAPGLSKRRVMLIIVVIVAALLVTLLIYSR